MISEKLTILHTNDVHSHIDPFPDDPRNPNMGGVARRASLIETIRKEDPNVYYLTPVIFSGDSLL
jgi:5'-nucleotidase